ncbi:polyprenyl synthetase family protein [Paludibacter sp. 221]|uniref:polyprenyl synthetase family protein n=1 Tax=Paludibacter sp. 221 TaxID=2302939 RepID=UPI0013D3C4E7|nr:polyprenyl synthetase family protein [Paludibacter sp. 221]NDV47383.1 polyprenyl synthetase family protein [Paludibacter sp. 221]
MILIEDIKKPILKEIHLFEERFAAALQSDNPLLSNINEHIGQGTGKQLRPILVILSAKIFGEINKSTIDSAVSLELLHTASLIHDDVVDDTFERRGRKSVNARWNNKIAILAGDNMLSNALYYATKTEKIDILYSISNIGMQLSDGELLQLSNRDQTKITEEEYFNVIRKKTALLFSTCTEVGALSVNASKEELLHLRNYGEYIGIAFQLKDDIFDYYENAHIGKPTGNDIRDGKVTLPLIFALQNAHEKEKEKICHWIKNKDFSQKNIREIMNFAHENGGIRYAEKQMELYKQKAINELATFPQSDIKDALIANAEFIIDRKI